MLMRLLWGMCVIGSVYFGLIAIGAWVYAVSDMLRVRVGHQLENPLAKRKYVRRFLICLGVFGLAGLLASICSNVARDLASTPNNPTVIVATDN